MGKRDSWIERRRVGDLGGIPPVTFLAPLGTNDLVYRAVNYKTVNIGLRGVAVRQAEIFALADLHLHCWSCAGDLRTMACIVVIVTVL